MSEEVWTEPEVPEEEDVQNEDSDEEQQVLQVPSLVVPDVGLNRMTATKGHDGVVIGWEAVCNHPNHQFPAQCRKNRRSVAAGRDAKTALRMLTAWLAWGKDLSDRDKHFQDKWDDVEAAAKNGTLPELEDITPVTKFGGVFEEDAHGRPGLAKRRKRQ